MHVRHLAQYLAPSKYYVKSIHFYGKGKGNKRKPSWPDCLVSHRLSEHYRTLWSTLRGGSFPEIVLKTFGRQRPSSAKSTELGWESEIRGRKGKSHL